MWLNQQTLDAIRMMAALAGKWPAYVKATDLSGLTGISITNVQKTANALGQAGLIDAARGRYGGLRIARSADTISIGDIVRAFEPKDCPVNFLTASPTDDAVAQLLFRAHRGFFQPLEATTLFMLGSAMPAAGRPGERKRRLSASGMAV